MPQVNETEILTSTEEVKEVAIVELDERLLTWCLCTTDFSS